MWYEQITNKMLHSPVFYTFSSVLLIHVSYKKADLRNEIQ